MILLPAHIAEAWGNCGLRPDSAALHRGASNRTRRHGRSDVYRFWHVLAGRISGDFGSGPIVAGPGTGLILPPDRGYLVREESSSGGVVMLIALFRIVVAPGATNPLLQLRLPAAVASSDPATAATLCERIATLSPTWLRSWPLRLAMRPWLDQLLTAHLVDGFAAGVLDAGPPLPGWIADLRERAVWRLKDPDLCAANLHAIAGRSREHVSRALRRHLGTGAAGLLRRLRVELAARLLTQGDTSIGEIAERVGYRDQSLFCRHFRVEIGVTPSAWRDRASATDHG